MSIWYCRIHPMICLLAACCGLAGFFLPFLGYWTGSYEELFTLHSLALCGSICGMLAGWAAAILRENAS